MDRRVLAEADTASFRAAWINQYPIDLERGVVIASHRMPLLLDDLLERGRAVRNDTDEVGNPVVWIHRLEIRGGSGS